MKNQYFGDVNDYLKYGLLRRVSRAGLRVGVCWMLTPDEARLDGQKTGYLHEARFREHDPELFDALVEAVHRSDGRRVESAKAPAVLSDASFFRDLVPDRDAERAEWFAAALETLRGADVLFFDPDNGMEVRSRPWGTRHSSKYLFWREVTQAWGTGASLLLFQHFARVERGLHAEQLTRALGSHAEGSAVATIDTANVLFLLAAQRHHRQQLDHALTQFSHAWRGRARVAHVAV